MKQITVITPNEVGLAAKLTEIINAAEINIDSFVADTIGDRAIFIFTVDQYDKAMSVLRDAGFEAISEDAILIKLEDKPGALARITRRFADAGLNVRSIRILHRLPEYSVVAVAADRTVEAMEILKDVMLS